MLFVLPELKLNIEQNVDCYSVRPTIGKPNVVRSFIILFPLFQVL